jgi:hypothetical protein
LLSFDNIGKLFLLRVSPPHSAINQQKLHFSPLLMTAFSTQKNEKPDLSGQSSTLENRRFPECCFFSTMDND